ncbi:MAG: 23S rRNA (guanosine(2251)-2'-O)-methyltransferase RlmB [Pirellulaceae bacterium]|nr:23S rRNA (guanosine(2251)-2'-O)-methyltransferase RlmB [Pirellulaceae bacterium]
MSERPQRPKKRNKKSFSGNHQRSWLWGHHAVRETLISGRWPVLEIYATQEAMDQLGDLLSRVGHHIPLEIVSKQRIEELSHATEHQGLLIRLGPYPYATFEQLESQLRVLPQALVVICDRIQDGFNLGAILRCCDGVGAAAIVVGNQQQAEMGSQVVRSSAGAANHVQCVQVDDLVDVCQRLKQMGFRLVAADSNAQQSHWQADLGSKTALILGSEAIGVAPQLLEQCDQTVTIPMQGRVSSLNVAVAAGILLFEIRRQQLQ